MSLINKITEQQLWNVAFDCPKDGGGGYNLIKIAFLWLYNGVWEEAKLLLRLLLLISFLSRLGFLRYNIQFDFQVVFYKVGYAVGAIKRCHYYGPAGKNESLGVLLLSPAAALSFRNCIQSLKQF